MRKLIALIICSAFMAPFLGAQEKWHGGTRYDYQICGRDAIVVVPEKPAPGNPWIWRPAFFDAFPSVDVALLAEGWHIAYYDVTHCYGSPAAVELARKFYDDAVVRFQLNPKMTIEGFSRGGYFSFAWSQAYPETLASMYLDAPVCDMTSWPGRADTVRWAEFLDNWGITDSEVGPDFRGNALLRLPEIAAAHIPIMAVCGGKDEGVPLEDNFAPVRDAYEKMGGVVELIVKPECGHHPHSLDDPEPVVDFLKRYAPGYADYQDIRLRGSLDNSLYAMTVRKKACVAFLGGSITEMKGWRDMTKDDLQQRFPHTEFEFIDAGISSLGSTPHAFRFEQDVLSHGTPDLLFVEAAVNDDTNEFSPQAQVRGMEGIVRHALKANPMIDIVMLDFIYDPFLPLMDAGETPDVVLNHERVANRYHIPSINLVNEIHSRISAGELTWEQFGGTHPAWLGHKYYAAAISSLLDANTKDTYSPAPHAMPAALDEGSYSGGRLVSIGEARALKGFSLVQDWTPSEKVGTRPGFVNVPMLSAEHGGSLSFDFEGNAVGIFCVAGPDAAVIEYRIDKGEWESLDTFTHWSEGLYLPWVYMLGEDLPSGRHTLQLKVPSKGRSGCHIRDFVVCTQN